MIRFLIGEKGFSLVQGMVIAGIVAGSSLVATRMLTDQKLAQKGAESRDQLEDFNDLIYSTLQNRLNCKQTIIANSQHLNIVSSPAADLPLTTIETKDGAIVTNNPAHPDLPIFYMNNNIKLGTMILKPQVGGTRNLEINYERLNTAERTKNGYGAKVIKKIIVLRIQKEPNGGAFAGCYSVTGGKANKNGTASSEVGNDISKEACLELNNNNTGSGSQTLFQWDEANSICKPTAACPANQIYTGFDSVGLVKCRNIEEWMNFNEVLDPVAPNCPANNHVANLEINSVTRKVKIVCVPRVCNWTVRIYANATCSGGGISTEARSTQPSTPAACSAICAAPATCNFVSSPPPRYEMINSGCTLTPM